MDASKGMKKSGDVEEMKFRAGMRVRKRVVQDGPEEDIETEGERYLHSLAKKQMMTDITLEKQFSQHRQFSATSATKPHVDNLVGVVPLKDYQKTDHLDARIEELSRYGLTNDEIQLKIKQESGKLTQEKRTGVVVNPDIEKEQLAIIDAKIAERQSSYKLPVHFSDVQKVTRHEMDLEKAICSSNTKDGQLSKYLVVQKDYEKSNPLSIVPDLMTEMEDKINLKFRERRRERKKKKTRVSVNHEETGSNNTISHTLEELKDFKGPYSKWEPVIPVPTEIDIVHGPLPQSALLSSCSLKTTHVIEQIPEMEILDNRLTCEEIKQIPKFENYNKGEVNNVLYIKNIDNKVSEEDLISVFGRFRQDDKSNIQYKLMTGRMRGQAFITFPDAYSAMAALEMINGFKLKDKHLIIQYGKPSNK